MPDVVAIRHVAFEDLGSFAPVLAARGYKVRYVEAGMDDLDTVGEPDVLVVLGGPIGANDEADYPFLAPELRLIAARLKAGRPILGICLGAQLMAKALGARVYPGPRKEIGWAPLQLTADGHGSPLAYLAPDKTPVLHWHGDTFDLPKGAARLASTPITPNQAFSLGPTAMALQFHPEATGPGLERWFIGHTGEIAATGLSVPRLRDDSRRHAANLERQGQRFLEAWLAGLTT